MEATGGAAGLLGKIVPPRIEDAGLEDCALPPESIKEAFLKAASAVRSHIFSDSDADGSDADCVNDPWTGLEDSGDKLVGITPEIDPPGPCAAKKGGGLPEVAGEDVVVAGVREAEEEGADKVLEPEVNKGGDACVDGLEGLKIGEKKGKTIKSGSENEEEEEDDDKPILAETYV